MSVCVCVCVCVYSRLTQGLVGSDPLEPKGVLMLAALAELSPHVRQMLQERDILAAQAPLRFFHAFAFRRA